MYKYFFSSITILCFVFLLLSCNKNESIISYIPESSWICYSNQEDSLYVVNDEWYLYNIDLDWNVLRKKYIWKYDLEWISCFEQIYIISENNNLLIHINVDTLEIENKYKIELWKISKNKWIEWITNIWNDFYLVSQSSKDNLIKFNLEEWKINILKKYNLKYKDLSWLTFYDWYLYILSDKNNIIIKYDFNKNIILNTIPIIWDNQEWLTFDKSDHIYIADDIWKILKGSFKKNLIKFD